MDAPKRIFAWSAFPTSHLVGTWGVTRYPSNAEHYILAAEHDRIVAEKDAEIARLLDAARDVVRAYQEANPMRQADMHPASCGCLRCEIDRLGNACGRDPCGALDAAAIRAMKGERG